MVDSVIGLAGAVGLSGAAVVSPSGSDVSSAGAGVGVVSFGVGVSSAGAVMVARSVTEQAVLASVSIVSSMAVKRLWWCLCVMLSASIDSARMVQLSWAGWSSGGWGGCGLAGGTCAGGVEGPELDLVVDAVGDPSHGVANGGGGAAPDAPPAPPGGFARGPLPELVLDDGAV